MEVGKNIRKYRKEKGLTQKQLGEQCVPKILEGTIRKYELNYANPKFETVERIAAALNVKPFDLMGPDYWNQKYPEISNEVQEYDSLTSFLQSIGYTVKTEEQPERIPEELVPDKFKNDSAQDVEGVSVNYLLTKGKSVSKYTEGEWDDFKAELKQFVAFNHWKQRQRKEK